MLKRNLLANYLGQGWTAIMSIAFIPVYIKYLGIESYGLIGLFAVLQAWLMLLDMGMAPTMSREMARFTGGTHSPVSIRDLLRSIEIIALVMAVLVALVIALGSDWLASNWLQTEELSVNLVARAFFIMGVVAALRFVEGIYQNSLVGLQRQVLLNVLRVLFATLRGLGAVAVLIWIAPTIDAFFIWQGIVATVSLTIFVFFTYKSLPDGGRSGRFSVNELGKVGRYAGGMVGITVLSLLLTQVDKILLSRLLPLTEFGYYTFAAVVAGALYMLVGPISGAWFPRLSQLHALSDSTALVRTYHLGAQLVSVIAGSAALVIMLHAETLLQVWTLDAVLAERTAPLLRLLVLGNLLNSLMWIPYQAQLAHGWTSLTIRINLIAVLLVVPSILWVTPRYGAIGAAWVWVSLNAGYCLIGIQFMYRQILKEEKSRWYFEDIFKPILAASLGLAFISWILPNPGTFISGLSTLALASVLTLVSATLGASQVFKQVQLVISSFFLGRVRAFER